jgi:hypothetical protein
MSEPMRDPMRRQLTSGRRSTAAALLPWEPRPSTETSIPGHLCKVCLDAPATRLQAAPWGGEMGVCAACGGLPGQPVDECWQHDLRRAHSPTPSRRGTLVYMTCGVCGVRCVTTAVLWQAEQARRRAQPQESP